MLFYEPTTALYPFSQLFDGPRPLSYLSSKPQCHKRSYGARPTSYNRQYEFNDLFDSLMSLNHNSKPRVQTKLLDLTNSYQIKLFKNYGGFNDYMITFRVNAREEVELLVKSEKDGFEKVFMFRYKDIKVKQIDYDINGNSMLIIVPKRHEVKKLASTPSKQNHNHVSKPKSPRSPRRLSNDFIAAASKSTTPKPAATSKALESIGKTELSPSEQSRSKIISIPINFEAQEESLEKEEELEQEGEFVSAVSSPLTPATTYSETEVELDSEEKEEHQSDSESISSFSGSDSEHSLNHLPKVARKVSLEDVQDEGF